MGQLRDRMEADLRLAGYSPSTRKIYLGYARLFTTHHTRSPAEMGEDEIRQYLLHMVEGKKISRETYRQIRASSRRAAAEEVSGSGAEPSLPSRLGAATVPNAKDRPESRVFCGFLNGGG